jgi:hypothetical protein
MGDHHDRNERSPWPECAEFTQVPNVGHFIVLERPDLPANLLNSAA